MGGQIREFMSLCGKKKNGRKNSDVHIGLTYCWGKKPTLKLNCKDTENACGIKGLKGKLNA